MNHTPGPWTLRGITIRGNSQHPNHHDAEDPQSRVCEICRNYYVGRDARFSDEDRANAHLIAAAPEMLEALLSIAEGCSFPEDDVQKAVRDRARAAIAKAKGETI